MAAVYARLILQGKKTIDDIPDKPEGLKEQVLAILEENDYPMD